MLLPRSPNRCSVSLRIQSLLGYLCSPSVHFRARRADPGILELSCKNCLYIFEINSLSVASFAIVFSHSEGCLFTLLIVYFFVQKLLSLIRSHLFLLLFSLLWEVGHRTSCCDLCQSVLPRRANTNPTQIVIENCRGT